MSMDKKLEIAVESHLVTQEHIEVAIQQCNEHINFEFFLDDYKTEVGEELKNIEQFKIGSRIWTITFTEQSWSKDYFLICPYRKAHGYYTTTQVTFLMTEDNGEWEISNDLSDYVIPFFAERGKVLNVPKLIDFVKQLSKYVNDETSYFESVIDADGNAFRESGLNIYVI